MPVTPDLRRDNLERGTLGSPAAISVSTVIAGSTVQPSGYTAFDGFDTSETGMSPRSGAGRGEPA
ncbi:MAG: hypothetical protein HOQ44_01055 [Nocardia sp.]|nr:hypothetical protein [Nocardia sp.]